MNYSVLIIGALVILIFAIVFKIKEKQKDLEGQKDKESPVEETLAKSEEFDDLNEKFIHNSKNRKAINFVKTYNPSDQIIIRSLLDSSGIESYSKLNSASTLFPGFEISGFSDSVICIFEDKKKEAYEIVNEFINVLKDGEPEKLNSIVRNIAEFTIGGYVVPSGRNRSLPEILIRDI